VNSNPRQIKRLNVVRDRGSAKKKTRVTDDTGFFWGDLRYLGVWIIFMAEPNSAETSVMLPGTIKVVVASAATRL
jgi:hypothetical protein